VLNKFKAGHYIIKHDSNLLEVFNTLMNEKSLMSFFTVPEGKNMFEVAKMLEENSITSYSDFIELARDKDFL
jgi:UPF0755 protein